MPDRYQLRRPRSPYLKIFAIIVGAIAALVVVVILLASTSARITIYPREELITAEFNAEIVTTEASGDKIAGRVLSTTVRGTEKIDEVDRRETDKPATGRVTLHNDLDQDQPLLATTRLLAENGTLFHLKERITLKAHSTAEAEIYADQPGRVGEIGPSRFTLPGLWKDWQTKIYAESQEPTTGGFGETDYISAETIENGIKNTVARLAEDGKAKLQKDLRGSEKILDEAINIETLSATSTVPPDSFAAEFSVSAEIRLTAVIFDKSALEKIAEEKLRAKLKPDQQIRSLNLASLQTSLITADLARKTATLAVKLDAPTYFQIDSDKIRKDKLIGRNREEVIDYLQRTQPIGEVEVKFTPNCVTTVPAQEEKITISLP